MVEVKADALERSFDAFENDDDGVAALKAELELLKAKVASGAIAAQRPTLDFFFSIVGTALGVPLGGAIGALIGQSIDQALLSPGSRGPRLGDLSVQTSTYGSEIPRIYGSMRVAGSVIWVTDLTESTATTGAKGQPDTVYSYSVSLAVALSSRPLKSIKRIWADGSFLRGQDGTSRSVLPFVFTTAATIRFRSVDRIR